MRHLFLLLLLLQPLCAQDPLSGISNFGWDLLQTTSTVEKNTLFSPYSTYISMTEAAMGANGETLRQMQKILYLPAQLKDMPHALVTHKKTLQPQVELADGLWIASSFPILPSYRRVLENEFNSTLQALDFSHAPTAAHTINQWIADHTDQKITHLVTAQDLSTATRLILTNALYFSGKFLSPFDPKKTSDELFWVQEESAVLSSMMEKTATFLYAADDFFQTIAIPFEERTLALVLCLPKERTFSSVATQLSSEKFQLLLAQLSPTKLHLRIPRFTLQVSEDLSLPLSKLGLTTAFTSEADFSGVGGRKDLFISQLLHAAFFTVDENGVVASGATAAVINTTSTVTPAEEFEANHPFVFSLVDLKTNIPLFLGELRTPQ